MDEEQEERRAYFRAWKRVLNYDVTPEHYWGMAKSQNYRCAICKCAETAKTSAKDRIKSLAIDHDHKTGEVRGLLCSRCNLGLGYFRDKSEVLEEAVKYLKKGGNKTGNFVL